MAAEALAGPPHVRRKLAELAGRPVNFDPAALERADPREGWKVTDLCQPLVPEPPGMPVRDGSWEIARRLMWGYEFADPSIVRAYYDPGVPLQGRNMLLKLQAFGLFRLYVGVRVVDVYERTSRLDGRTARVWGWAYRTLQGHVEMGQMAWEVWKWVQDGQVEFRVHAVSRTAPIRNPVVRLGFALLEPHERAVFLNSTKERMRRFVELAHDGGPQRGEPIQTTAAELTARPSRGRDVVLAHDQLARQLSGNAQRG
jgi:uncharacterized protein (UPF0548 family)